MDFDVLDRRMRVFEMAHDYCVLPGIFMMARADGRNFTRLTKEICSFQAPFDERMRDHMTETARHLMQCGFRVIYGYTQSDEISLLFHRDEDAFGRKTRKFNSILAGEASAKLSLLLGTHAAFDCRISELPRAEDVVDYFRWRSEDAHRNALNGHCYWLLRGQGQGAAEASHHLEGFSVAQKNELLFRHGINFNDLPNWQKRGVGLYWEAYTREATNPLTGEALTTTRRRIKVENNLPMKEQYSAFLTTIVNGSLASDQSC